ncbi:multiple sugar transport system substrate-binding protein [Mumia flava]|uniref:Multiple sugar transport system substrate-binding protein n=1 Tax=Mumia flava TaxID=1348852 RepID=A0A0B2BUB8_9ACTN|nr:extracellular solute-binding protein [Mumia flava]PJJ57963.1 multiple sugar transport system substrate-binding protein [Mumia flava]
MAVLKRRAASAALAAAALLLVAACGGGDDDSDASSDSSCEPAADGEKVTLTFSSWVPGMQETVDLWNENNPDIQVKYKEVVGGNEGTYQAYSNQIKAGTTGDIGMVEFDNLASFRLQDGLYDIGGCEPWQEAEGDFVDWTVSQVSFGEDGSAYGVPMDVGPMALYYRKDLFEQNDIGVPTTWDEYYEAAKKIKALGATIGDFPPDQPAWFTSLAWQNGATWFSEDGGTWTVSLNDDATEQVADYWQKLLDERLLDTVPGLGDPQWNALDNGKEWSIIGAAWTTKLLENSAPKTAGKWAVAPMPQWEAGDNAAGNWGGSNAVVFKNTEHPYEAAKFATWAFSAPEALALNNKNGGQYPATTEGQASLPALTEGLPYYGDQKVWEVFAEASKGVDPSFQWGPTMTQTYSDLGNGLGQAVNGQATLADALEEAQSKTVDTMEAQSLDVSE